MMYNVLAATRETHAALRQPGVWPTTQQTEESQTTAWESDTVIVPQISGNADVGKDVYTSRPCPRDTLTIHRDR